MAWAIAYLALGALTLVVLLVHDYHRPDVRRARFLRKSGAVDAPRDPLRQRVIEYTVVPLVVALVVLVGWPVMAGITVRDEWRERLLERARTQTQPLRIRRRDLRNRYTRAEVEAREYVHDPLSAVPQLPFGHLHPAWERFLASLRPGARLHAFAAVTHPEAWRSVRCEGYVAVSRLGCIGQHFLVVHEDLSKP